MNESLKNITISSVVCSVTLVIGVLSLIVISADINQHSATSTLFVAIVPAFMFTGFFFCLFTGIKVAIQFARKYPLL